MESRKRSSGRKVRSIASLEKEAKLDKLADDIKKLPDHRKKLLKDLMKKRLYDSKEVCKILKISLPSLRRAFKLGRIKTVHVGRLLRIPAEEIQRIVKDEEELVNVNEAAILLNVKPATIRTWIRNGQIKTFRFTDTGPFRINKSEIDKILSRGLSLLE